MQEDRYWGFNAVRAGAAHGINGTSGFQHGHAYIGVNDQGLNPNHIDFVDYSGSTWKGGNFHPALSFSIGSNAAAVSNPSYANPYFSSVVMGSVDEYHLPIVPGDNSGCDTNNNGTVERDIAGHGTHVTGIIAANATNGTNVSGVCRHCAISMSQFIYPKVTCINANPPLFHPDEISPIESKAWNSFASFYTGVGFQIDTGVQILNMSGGEPEILGVKAPDADNNSGFCASNLSDPRCLLIQYAQDRDVFWVASAGNYSDDELHFPAADPHVIGVSGTRNGINGALFWTEDTAWGPEHGSSFGTNSTNGPTFSAPARDVYSTMYKGKKYVPHVGCDDLSDGVEDDYGYCTGTSMSAPFISGVAGLVRSTNPLATVNEVIEVMKNSTGQSSYSNTLGWGTPRADVAVKEMLGKSAGVQVLNRVTPLFSMESSVADDIVHTTKPQVAMAYNLNMVWGYTPYSSEAVVNGYTFPESPLNPTPAAPRADLFILTTHRQPANGGPVTPLYRLRFVGPKNGNPSPNNADWLLALDTEISGSSSFRSEGYEMDGIEGYIYTVCSPEPSCIPAGAVKVYRAYHPSRDDHAIFPESKITLMQSISYTNNLKKLGYAYPNLDSDSDGVIDGMEHILGTDRLTMDSDCDGLSDGAEYPLTSSPVSDPMNGSCGGGGGAQTPWGSNAGAMTLINQWWLTFATGYHFSPLVNGSVTQLGGYFNGTYNITLFNNTTGQLLRQIPVASNNNWAYVSVPPIQVVAGETYTVSVYFTNFGGAHKQFSPLNYFPQTFGDITILGTTVLFTYNPLMMPTNTHLQDMLGQVDIMFIPD